MQLFHRFFQFLLILSISLLQADPSVETSTALLCKYDEESRLAHVSVSDPNTKEFLGWIQITYEPFSMITSDGFFFNEEMQAMTPIPRALSLMPSSWAIQSDLYQTSGFTLEKGGIGFINGVYNFLEMATAHAERISQYGGKVQVSHVYNASHSLLVDLAECVLGYLKIPTPPVLLLLKQWDEFDKTHDSEEKFLQIAHSQGAIHVRNALLIASEEVRSRIIVVAIAPAAIIPSSLCYKSYNYVSRKDIVPYFDVLGNKYYHEELIFVDPHPEAKDFDHFFDSPTFESILEFHINEYLQSLN